MKQALLLLTLLFFSMLIFAQSNTSQWAWMRGDSIILQTGVYGQRGIPSPLNKPAARQNACTWTDAAGNLWMFGGRESVSGVLNDLWKYSPATNQWTWMTGATVPNTSGTYGTLGIDSSVNTPGARYGSAAWTDAVGNLWLFGGNGYDRGVTGVFNDLWKFNPVTNQWTWVRGDKSLNPPATYGTKGVASANNTPQGRYSTACWKDANGRFWLFGGATVTMLCNDMWMYDPSSNEWTWINGDINPQTVSYGTKGVEAASNKPGMRRSGSGWTDKQGKIWIFGGAGYNTSFSSAALNDLWKFDPATGLWTWVSGTNALNQSGIYGTSGLSSGTNTPGSRFDCQSWTDTDGDLWLFGGSGYGSAYLDGGTLNDLWKFSPATAQWTWVKGSDSSNKAGEYGARGIPGTETTPGTRVGAASWTDGLGNFWISCGGTSFTSTAGSLNDLWKYSPSANQWTWMNGDNINTQTGHFGTMGIEAPENTPSIRMSAVSWRDASGNLLLFGGNGLVTNNSDYGPLNDLWRYSPSSNQWTWIGGSKAFLVRSTFGTKGVEAPENFPGVRYGSTYSSDASGNLFMYGGMGRGTTETGSLNDFWRYNGQTGQWTWLTGDNQITVKTNYGSKGISSPSNSPGSREKGVGWTTAAGDFYLFGGLAAGNRNDLWKYSVSNGQWTWIGGDNTPDSRGVYGTIGVENASNKPGARYNAVSWTDAAGNLWLFGGSGYGETEAGYLNDLWKYNTLTGNWTCVKGSRSTNRNGVYGKKDIAAATNQPGARYGSISWSDALGNLWLMGGSGYSINGPGDLNDLWKFQPSSGQWTWMNGSSSAFQPGIYGTRQSPAVDNTPGARREMAGWTDAAGQIWLFGGMGYLANGLGKLNDMWRMATPLTSLPVKFLKFTAEKEKEAARLDWTIAAEKNATNFVVEHSVNGRIFESIGIVPITSATNYSFLHKSIRDGENFYRVKQSDPNGTDSYTAIAKLTYVNPAQVNILGNPVKNTLKLEFRVNSFQELKLEISDVAGRLLVNNSLDVEKGNTVQVIDVSKLKSGSYLINLRNGAMNISKQFVKD